MDASFLLEMMPPEARKEFMMLTPEDQSALLEVLTGLKIPKEAVIAAAAVHPGGAGAQPAGARSPVVIPSAVAAADPAADGVAADVGTPRVVDIGGEDDDGDVSEEVMWHGRNGQGQGWDPPKVAAASGKEARPGYFAYDASEYLDTPDVLKQKIAMLAQMWRRSGADTVVYTGAGLSTASGIGDYASKADSSVAPHKKKAASGSRLDLKPTLAHHCLAAIEQRGLIGNWVQQNHDRLAQKAGYPQAKLNEIHGAWGDNKNQVKMMDDTLRVDLIDWLQDWADRANMCVALGTTLCGMNADRVCDAVAQRFRQSTGEGLVIIGLQRTRLDDVASLRIWGLCDNVMKLLAKELGLQAPNPKVVKRGEDWSHGHPRLMYNTPKRTARDPM